MNYLLPRLLDLLAREYAIGTLTGPARRRFERVLQSSQTASAAVDLWCESLSVLDLSLVPMSPPASNWPEIERRLSFNSAPIGRSLSEKVLGWFWGRTLGAVLAAVLGGFVLLRLDPVVMGLEPLSDSVSPSYIGLVLSPAGKPVLVVSSRRQGRQLTLKLLQTLDVPAGRFAQLWAVPDDGAGPFPMSALPLQGSSEFELPDTSERLLAKVSQIAISFETSTVKPGDKPSGAFVLTGNCVKVW